MICALMLDDSVIAGIVITVVSTIILGLVTIVSYFIKQMVEKLIDKVDNIAVVQVDHALLHARTDERLKNLEGDIEEIKPNIVKYRKE